ncbi:MAG: XdhC family protein, partial [Tepidiformaceae bacterium]
MYDIVKTLDTWKAEEVPAVVARTIALHGFGARTDGESLAFAASGDSAGSLLSGVATGRLLVEAQALLDEARPTTRIADVDIEHVDAIAAGYACGGRADVMLQRAESIPIEAWDALRASEPFVIASVLGSDEVLAVDSRGPATGPLNPPELHAMAVEQARQLLAQSVAGARISTFGERQVFIECFVPVTHLVVVGGGILAEALSAQAELLGWSPVVTGDGDATEGLREVARLRRPDALVLLSHNREIDAAILGGAIRRGAGYVGALGSRATQA